MAQKKKSPRSPEQKAATAAKREQRRARADRAAAQAQQRREAAKKRERLTMIGVVVGVLVLIVGGVFLVRALNPAKPDTPPEGATASFGLKLGEDDAPKQVVVYEDFLCPFCGQLETTVRDRLNDAVEAGEVSVEFRPINFLERYGDYSAEAANALAVVLEQSGPEVAKEFHDLLFDNQPSENGPFLDEDELVDLAVEAGATEADVRPGIEDMTFEGWVDAASEAASKAGINATPTVLVDGETVDATTIDGIADAMVGAS